MKMKAAGDLERQPDGYRFFCWSLSNNCDWLEKRGRDMMFSKKSSPKGARGMKNGGPGKARPGSGGPSRAPQTLCGTREHRRMMRGEKLWKNGSRFCAAPSAWAR